MQSCFMFYNRETQEENKFEKCRNDVKNISKSEPLYDWIIRADIINSH